MFELTPNRRKQEGLTGGNDIWDLRNVIDGFFNESFLPAFFGEGHPMKADIRENEKEYIIDAELPGIKKEDIKLDLRDDSLTISVEQKSEVKEERDAYIRRERKYGSYSRSFYVQDVKHEDVSAKYNDGVLTIILPKQDGGKSNKRNIEIQ